LLVSNFLLNNKKLHATVVYYYIDADGLIFAGPFVSALSNKYGFRSATILGAVLGALGFGLSYFATNVGFLYVTYGIIGGEKF
jgi:hypothetical protein